jgi:hypothetical protein
MIALAELVLVGVRTVGRLAAEFPTLRVEAAVEAPPDLVRLSPTVLWAGGPIGVERERALDQASAVALEVADEEQALAVATRLQWRIDRRNPFSAGAAFDAVLLRHAALHDRARPLGRADWQHARDRWHWLLRLDSAASLPAQLAALFQEVEWLEPPPVSVEHRGPGCAPAPAALPRALDGLPLPQAAVARAAALLARDGGDDDEPERALLRDADALSFFSLASADYLDGFGPTQTRKKLRASLARLSARGLCRLREVGLRPDVHALLADPPAPPPLSARNAAPAGC